MKFEFIPIDYNYFDFNDKNYIQIIGRNEKGKKICVLDSYDANFWIILKHGADAKRIAEKISKIKIKKASRTSRVLKTEISDKMYLGKK